MKIRLIRPSFLGVSAMLIATCGFAAAQTAPQSAQSQTATQSNMQNMQLVSANAQLLSAVNSNDASQGQTVKAKLTSAVKSNGVKLDKGTMLIGKLEQVQKSGDNGPSKMSLVFDRAQLKDGETVPVKATLLGAYPPLTGGYPASGTLMPVQPHNIPNDQVVDQNAGELGHVAMHSSVQSDVSGVFTSKDRNINLKRGTQLQVAIAPETTTAG